jgi:hypothetical protein
MRELSGAAPRIDRCSAHQRNRHQTFDIAGAAVNSSMTKFIIATVTEPSSGRHPTFENGRSGCGRRLANH